MRIRISTASGSERASC